MKVLLISGVSGYMIGGTSTEIKHLIAGLQESGYHVAILIDNVNQLAQGITHFPMPPHGGKSMGQQVTIAIREFQPDVIHVIAMSSRGINTLGPILKDHAWLMTIHSLPPHERKWRFFHGNETLHYLARDIRFFANSLAWRWVLKSQDIPNIIVHSDFVRNVVIAKGGKRECINLIPLPFIANNENIAKTVGKAHDEKSLVLSTVGGIAHTKGQHDVVKALPALIEKFPKLTYHIIGEVRDTSYLRYLNRLLQKLDLVDNVRLHVSVGNIEKNEILRSTDVYIQPSHEEGFCFAYFEAAALVPRLIGTNTGAIAAASNADLGARVIHQQRPMELATAIIDLLSLNLQISHMGDRNERLQDEFSLRNYLAMHGAAYLKAIQKKK